MSFTAPIILGKMHSLLISENEFLHEIKCNGMTSFMEFMISFTLWHTTWQSIDLFASGLALSHWWRMRQPSKTWLRSNWKDAARSDRCIGSLPFSDIPFGSNLKGGVMSGPKRYDYLMISTALHINRPLPHTLAGTFCDLLFFTDSHILNGDMLTAVKKKRNNNMQF